MTFTLNPFFWDLKSSHLICCTGGSCIFNISLPNPKYTLPACSAAGSSEAGGERASGGGEGRERHRDAGERPGGAEEARWGDQPAPANRGQRTVPSGEKEDEGG